MKDFWLVSVNMGYGHQRTIFPLKNFAYGKKIVNANDYSEIPEKDKKIWLATRKGYELISRVKKIPILGNFVFLLFDQFQKILEFYPKRDLSIPTFQLKQNDSLIRRGWGKDLINKLEERPTTFITSFFTPAFMAEHFKYSKDIYCIICDADIARTWAPMNPKKSKIKYLVPNERVVERLKLYGVKPKNIFLTGYPLPLENIGTKKMEVLKMDIKNRLANLDVNKKYSDYYEPLIKSYLGNLPKRPNHPLTVMFAVGGAGAQAEIGYRALKSLRKKIKKGKVKFILVAGTKKTVKEYFEDKIVELRLLREKNVEILFDDTFEKYFNKFNKALRKTDILWTKPSELSFYSALGLPIIIAPCIGSQEKFNRNWLLKSGFGISQGNPNYTDQWLFDWLEKGYFAEAALQGFIEGKQLGTLNIKEIVSK
ncbi:MAG: hypothetical protein ABIA08_00585 [bacterium]